MIELDDDTVQAIREGALPGVRWCRDSWEQECLFEAPDLEEYRSLVERRLLWSTMSTPERAAPIERARRRGRPRRPNLEKLIAKAKAAGATSVTTPEGYTYKFGEPGAATATSPNPWDAEIARLKQ
jgi:hypothetical protein